MKKNSSQALEPKHHKEVKRLVSATAHRTFSKVRKSSNVLAPKPARQFILFWIRQKQLGERLYKTAVSKNYSRFHSGSSNVGNAERRTPPLHTLAFINFTLALCAYCVDAEKQFGAFLVLHATKRSSSTANGYNLFLLIWCEKVREKATAMCVCVCVPDRRTFGSCVCRTMADEACILA